MGTSPLQLPTKCLIMCYSFNLVWVLSNIWPKRNEILYSMLIKYKIFFGKGVQCCPLATPAKVPNLAVFLNPNTIKSYKILQKLSPKHAAHGVAQSTYPNYRHGKACLSKQPPWRAAGDPRLARGRSRVRAPGPAGALRALFSPPSLPSGDSFFAPSPPTPQKC